MRRRRTGILEPISGETHDEMVLIKDIPFFSVCEHHLTPFFGKAHIAYVPSEGKIVGLSKLATALEVLAKRPQVQERLTAQLADLIMNSLEPKGRDGRTRLRTPLHVDARGKEAGLQDGYVGGAGAYSGRRPSTRTEMLELIKKK